ncbi:glycosyltransferase family 4 protein [Mucilaginibacter antarcticus]|uniref:Glycosyltransferase n=1 Tax=Mucilaginibacter antarcticus TaxID=1855725 RepID=A0ABW5XMT4_9SPHI
MSKIMRLAIVTTHPIQYYAPVFKLLAAKIDLMVFYTWGETSLSKHDPGFGKTIQWDIDLLDGYPYQWLKNTASNAGSHHFSGINNPDLIKQVTNWKPDTILFYGWAYRSHLRAMVHFKNKIPVLFRGDSTLLDEKPGIKNWLRSVYLRWVYKHIDYALYTGTRNKAYFKKYGLADRQLVFAPHAIDNERFAVDRAEEVQLFKEQLNINEQAKIILFAGKLEDKKDPALLLNAFINLAMPNVHLLFVGDGVLKAALQQQAAAQACVHFVDFKNQSYMPVVYQACDIFCLPSIGPGETWGLAVNEAMACGKVILVSDKVGCAVDLVEPGINGYISEGGNKIDFTEKLQALLNNSKPELHAMGQVSSQKIASWSFNVQINNMVNLYERHQ